MVMRFALCWDVLVAVDDAILAASAVAASAPTAGVQSHLDLSTFVMSGK
jgi:hypothetical protein